LKALAEISAILASLQISELICRLICNQEKQPHAASLVVRDMKNRCFSWIV
jgi:hypothetical protein